MDGNFALTRLYIRDFIDQHVSADSVQMTQIDIVIDIGEKEKGNGVIVCYSRKQIWSKQSSAYSVECFKRKIKWREHRIFPVRKRLLHLLNVIYTELNESKMNTVVPGRLV